MEAYIDDMVIKSKVVSKHIQDLEEAFSVLKKYQLRLNTSKCSFRVSSRKFLGFMIIHRGIEVNPDLQGHKRPTFASEPQRGAAVDKHDSCLEQIHIIVV